MAEGSRRLAAATRGGGEPAMAAQRSALPATQGEAKAATVEVGRPEGGPAERKQNHDGLRAAGDLEDRAVSTAS